MNENTTYLRYIREEASRGKEKPVVKLFLNQKRILKELGFSVRKVDHQKHLYTVSCKDAEKGTYAYEVYGLVLTYRRELKEKQKVKH